jgi:hypothetical protein
LKQRDRELLDRVLPWLDTATKPDAHAKIENCTQKVRHKVADQIGLLAPEIYGQSGALR